MESSVISSTATIAAPVRKRQVKKPNDVNVPVGYKRCSHCGKIKPLDEFYNNRSQPDGKRHECKDCTKEAEKNSKLKSQQSDTPKLPFNYQRKVKKDAGSLICS